MITLAKITAVAKMSGTNLCTVYIPIFNTSLDATMMLPPGIHSGYKVGDIVFLAFTDNEINRPVVLGQLYVDNLTTMTKADNAGYVSCDFLEVEDTATVNNMTSNTVSCTSLNSTDIACTTLICNKEKVDIKALKDKVSELEKKVNTLTGLLNALGTKTQ